MARNDLGRQEWTIELTCLQWAFRQLRPDERDYVTKRLKHVLGKRTLKSSWYEKDAAMLRQLVMLCVWGARSFKSILLMAVDTDRMRAADYPGLPEDKSPEALFRRLSDLYRAGGWNGHEEAVKAGKDVLKQFAQEIEGVHYDRRAFGLLTLYVTAFGLAAEGRFFIDGMRAAFERSGSASLPVECEACAFDDDDFDIFKAPDEAPDAAFDGASEDGAGQERSESGEEAKACADDGGEAAPQAEEEKRSDAGAHEEVRRDAHGKEAGGTPAEATDRGDAEPVRRPANRSFGVAGARKYADALWAVPAPGVKPAWTVSGSNAPEKTGTVFARDFSLAVPPLPRGATRYLGYIRMSGGNFFNFYAVGEWYKDRFGALESEAKRLFPTYGAFNLKSAGRNQLKEGAFYVVDLMMSELAPNYDENGRVRGDFCKCVDFPKLTSSGRFFSASDFGIHIVVKPVGDLDRIDFTHPMIPVRVSDVPDCESGMKIVNELVLLEHKGLLYGPLRLKKDSRAKPYVTFSGLVHKGLVSAFRESAGQIESLREFVRWKEAGMPVYEGVRCGRTAFMEAVSVDVWSDADLMKRLLENAPVRAADLKALIERSEALEDVSEEVKEGRLARAKSVLGRLKYRDEARAHVADFVFGEVKSGNASLLEDVVSRAAADEGLIEVFASRTAVGRRLEDLEALAGRLEADVESQRGELARLGGECARLKEENGSLEASLEEKRRALGICDERQDVIAAIRGLDASLEARREELRRLEALRTKLVDESRRICERAAGDGAEMMPETLRKAVAAWDEEDARRRRERLAEASAGVTPAKLKGRELADALVGAVQEVRRYDANTVLNLYVCWVQNFLTVLSGEPGSGKTSICHILARTLGLDAFDGLIGEHERAGLSAGRFVHVPVEYGWTSKRDFIGYWNPITNRFESSDPARWNLLCTLDAEARSAAGSVYPAMMLLDEANLSPMEYYWSDWMRLCDERASSGVVTLWDKSPTIVPETLRFMATINNDSTTETLSPRLIDRAAVVTLPPVDCIEDAGPARVVGPVAWKEMQAYFGARAATKNAAEIELLNKALKPVLEGFGIKLSPRSQRQVDGYVGAASSIFADGDKPAWLDAADFALMQKCLPRITGTGGRYREKLVDLKRSLESLGLARSAAVVQRIVREGDEAMDCYRFF